MNPLPNPLLNPLPKLERAGLNTLENGGSRQSGCAGGRASAVRRTLPRVLVTFWKRVVERRVDGWEEIGARGRNAEQRREEVGEGRSVPSVPAVPVPVPGRASSGPRSRDRPKKIWERGVENVRAGTGEQAQVIGEDGQVAAELVRGDRDGRLRAGSRMSAEPRGRC